VTTTALIEHTVTVAGTPIFFAEAGEGPSVVMLHGGGPGASGVSNYSRNIDALAEHFRVIVPDMPGYGRSGKGVDQSDPFGYLAGMIRGLLDELGLATAHLVGNSYGGAAALRLALDTPQRVGKLVLMGPGGIGTTRGAPTAGLKSLLSYYGGAGPSRDKLEAFIRNYLVYGWRLGAGPADRRPLQSVGRSRGGGRPATAATVRPDCAAHTVADGSHP
jgi:4,5:9,10-diseco-3-hydroxy-5,9,17-trioxoandrosta-1(10),2-diene-4-oate hydrolase